jgi:predicted naringenin-chalcone synthase
MSYIVSIGTAVPKYKASQQSVLQKVMPWHASNEKEQRALSFVYQRSEIEMRYSALPDFSEHNTESILNLDEEKEISISLRQKFYAEHSLQLASEAIKNTCTTEQLQQATHLITVSCTGFSAPGLDLQLVEHLQLSPQIHRTSVNFMGCYAAIHAMKQAMYICNSNADAKVVLVCVELCTLHFQKNQTIDNVTSTAIFGDGAAAMFMTSKNENTTGIKVKDCYSEICAYGKTEMGWEISETGFLMTLTKQVPVILQEELAGFINRAKEYYNCSEEFQYCFHPGGKKILEAAEKALQIEKKDLEASYAILKQYGNMSSPTILFVLKEILNNKIDMKPIIGAAFGPGLTIESFYLTHEN